VCDPSSPSVVVVVVADHTFIVRHVVQLVHVGSLFLLLWFPLGLGSLC